MNNQVSSLGQITSTPMPTVGKPKDWFKILPVAVGFLIALGLFGNIYLLLRKEKPKSISQITPTPTQTALLPTPTIDQAADWITYRNEKYGYEVKYPPDWHLEKMSEIGVGGVDQLYSYEPPKIQVKDPNFFKNKVKITLGKMIQSMRIGQTLAGWIEDYEKNLEDRSILISQKNLIFAGQNTVKQTRDTYEEYFIEKNNEIYFISLGGDLTSSLKTISDQILSTFKFLPTEILSDEVKGWKTYRNEESGFEFKYPKEITMKEEKDSVFLSLYGPLQKDMPEFYDGLWLIFSLPLKIENDSLRGYVDACLKEDKRFETITKPIQELTINNLKGYTYTSGGIGNVYTRHIFLQSPDKVQTIKINDSTKDMTKQGYEKIVNQILSTFRFD